MRVCFGCYERLPDSDFYVGQLERGRPRCKRCKRKQVKAHQKRLKEERKCFHCSKPLAKKDTSLCSKCKTKRRSEYHADGDRRRAVSRTRAQTLKLLAFNAYGGVICACCDEPRVKFLTIDHINGGGAEHRRSLGSTYASGKNFYRWLKKNGYPPGYQVLCFNCNFAKGHYGSCPHEDERQQKLSLAAG